jgi:hypothetical protein
VGNNFVLFYLLFFIAWSVFGVKDCIESKYSKKIIAFDIFITSFSILGIFTFYARTPLIEYSNMWKIVFIVILLWEVYCGRVDYLDCVQNPDGELSDSKNKWANILGITVVTPVLYLPCLIIIFYLAFLN